ncbi:OPT oligopeptide transporter protein-domain-containing protein [Lactifluus volemus]|nr:OPT oligopeptide transporter protein-domain-containing protein [Lactifluus volemus]
MSRHEDETSAETERRDPEHLRVGEIDGLSLDGFDDPNLDPTATLFEDESPYPEVRAAVTNTDDPRMPSSTFRAWAIGLLWTILIPGVNQVLSFRYPSVSIDSIIALLLSFTMGKAWARYMPKVSVFGISLNPGPFTIKEHVIATVMASVSNQPAYAVYTISVQRVLYNQRPNFIYQWLFLMSTQLIGFSIGGICQRVLVAPASMIWPGNLAVCAIFNTLHAQDTAGNQGRDGISRLRFFTYISIGYFFYNFFPSYLFTALSYFSWVCWIAPNNVKINHLFGITHGLGMGLVNFDWGQITSFLSSPLLFPWWTAANTGFSIIFFYWFLLPILYYSNVWYSAYLPLVSSQAFDNTASVYNLSRVITPDGSFNLDGYQGYSPLFLPLSFVIFYGLSFASYTALLVHTLLYNSKQIWTHAFCTVQPDIHVRLMSIYKEVPGWWYFSILVITFAFGVVSIEVWDTQLPVWAFVLSVIISFVFTIPNGIIAAMTNNFVGLNVLMEFIVGHALPDRPIAMMMFKSWGYNTVNQAMSLTSSLKTGHYMKIPHRTMFFCVVIGTIVSSTVQLGAQAWMFSHIENFCGPDQKDNFICPSVNTFGTASIIWGVVGPHRLFSHGHLYNNLLFFFLAGAVAPLIQWIFHKKFKLTFLKYLNFPVIFSAVGLIPPATPFNYVSWVLICFVFNYVIRRRRIHWWLKYNYLLSLGLDVGYSVGAIVIFFALQYPKNGTIGLNTIQKWWGNTVYTKTADFLGVPYKEIPDGGKFGPSSW